VASGLFVWHLGTPIQLRQLCPATRQFGADVGWLEHLDHGAKRAQERGRGLERGESEPNDPQAPVGHTGSHEDENRKTNI
jgi:hypothetical protein